MARPLRIQYAGALYHVVSRGNDRGAIFRDDKDRERRLEWLQRTVDRERWRMHAFVLLPDRDHLFVQTTEPNLSAGMQYLNGCYTSYFNRRHDRRGHLFEGRYKGHLIQPNGYWLAVSRYVHRLPLVEKLSADLTNYQWSSFPGYRRKNQSLDWVYYSSVLGAVKGRSRGAYSRMVLRSNKDKEPSPFEKAEGGLILGSDEFLESTRERVTGNVDDESVPQIKTLQRRPSLEKIIEVVAKHFECDPASWVSGTRHDSNGRAVVAYLAREVFSYAAKEVAAAIGYKSHGSIRGAVLRVRSKNSVSAHELKAIMSRLRDS